MINLTELRKKLTQWSDSKLTTFCKENYVDVYNQFTNTMTKGVKVLLLIQHCLKMDKVRLLIKQVKS